MTGLPGRLETGGEIFFVVVEEREDFGFLALDVALAEAAGFFLATFGGIGKKIKVSEPQSKRKIE